MQTEEAKVPSWKEEIPLIDEEDNQVEVDAIGTVAPDDAYEVRTRHSFATHPVSKGVVVLGVSFMAVSTLGIFLKALTGGFSGSGNTTATVTTKPTPTSNDRNSLTEADTLRAKLLFNDQSKDIEKFNKQKQAQTREKVVSPTIAQSPPVQTVPITTPRPVYSPLPAYSRPQTPARSIVPAPTQQRPLRPVAPPPQFIPPVAKPSQPKVDPTEQWLAAANVGSYGSTSVNTSSTGNSEGYQTASASTNNEDDSNWQASGGTGTPPPEPSNVTTEQNNPTLAGANVATERQDTNLQAVSYSSAENSLIVGTKANGKLETPIAWTGRLENPTQNFLIKLNEPLKSANNSVAIPKGSYLVAKISAASEAGLLQMTVSSMLVNENGQTSEKPVPEGAILVLGKGGRPLKASAERPGSGGGNLGTVILSGISSATGLINQPSSQSIINSGGGYQSTITNGNPNYLAGFGQGAAQALLQQAQNRNQQALRSRQSEPVIFSLNQGSSVQVFVNQSVAL